MAERIPIRVLIVDDHAMVRSGLKQFVDTFDDLILAGEARNGAEAVELCQTNPPDVILMDLVMPVMDGREATRKILQYNQEIKIIVLTSFHEQDLVELALQAGAISYLLKNVSAEELAQAIRSARAGRSVLAPEATEALIQATRQSPRTGFSLTQREKEVLALIVQGNSNSEIGLKLNISIATVKFHVRNIFSKLGVKNRLEATTLAWQNNLVNKS
jgi:two-component system, NarL family, response regulator LiaR